MKALPRPENGHHYTAAEIVQILERARDLGVAHLKLPGFEATWELEPREVDHSKPAPLKASGPPLQHQRGYDARPAGPHRVKNCPDCGGAMVPSKIDNGLYCKPCYIDRKEGRRG